MQSIVNGLKSLTNNFSRSLNNLLDAKSKPEQFPGHNSFTLRTITDDEDNKESPADFSEHIDRELLHEISLTRLDSNGCVTQRYNPRSDVPPRSGKSMQYVLTDKIGEGAYGKVYRAIDVKNQNDYAIKISKLTEDNRNCLLAELDLLRKLQSPYIVSVYDGFIVGEKLWLVMEHCIGGSILDVLKLTKKKTLDEPLMKGVIASLLLALEFLHGHRIIHRDIKASNLVLTLGGRIKLIDFGISTVIKPGEEYKHTVTGSPYWMAPEVIEGRSYDEKVDIWSLGMTILELCEPGHPLFSIHPVSVLFKIVTADAPRLHKSCAKQYSLAFNHFFSRCMKKDPNERLSSKCLMEHLWIKSTVDTLVTATPGNTTSSVEALEKLFMHYVMHDELQMLAWDQEDEREACQEPDEEGGQRQRQRQSQRSMLGQTEPETESVSAPPPPRLKTATFLLQQLEELDLDLINFSDTSLPLPPPPSVPQSPHESAPDPLKSPAGGDGFQDRLGFCRQESEDCNNVEDDPGEVTCTYTSPDTSSLSVPSLARAQRPSFNTHMSSPDHSQHHSVPSPSPHLLNAHSHPNSLHSKPPTMLATPPSLRHPTSQSYISRVLAGVGRSPPNTTSYCSLGSFEPGSYIFSPKLQSSRKRSGSMDTVYKEFSSSRSYGTNSSTSGSLRMDKDKSYSGGNCDHVSKLSSTTSGSENEKNEKSCEEFDKASIATDLSVITTGSGKNDDKSVGEN